MTDDSLVLAVLGAATLAALTGALGALVYLGPARVPRPWLGWASAAAGGIMFGAAYALMDLGGEARPVAVAAGAILGVLFVAGTHRFQGTGELDLTRTEGADATYAFRVLTTQALHSASEGVAIGAAALINLTFGIVVAGTLALHNVAEAFVMSAVVRGRGATAGQAAALGVFTNVPQVLLAVVTVAVVAEAPATLPWVVGFAVGSLVHLVLTELLPEAYESAGALTTALATSLALGVMILTTGVLQ